MTEPKLSRRDSLRGLLTLGAAGAAAAVTGTVLATAPAQAVQFDMDAALAQLRQAREALAAALPNKGGFRVRALRELDAAINDVVAGIQWARTH